MRKNNNYDMQQIGNVNEKPMNFDMPPSRTVNTAGKKSILIKTTGNEKNHFTVVLACLAGDTKLKVMIIFKRKTMPKEEIPHGVLVNVHEKGWMEENGMHHLWIEKVWESRPGGLLQTKACLVYDMFKAHLVEPVKKRLKDINTDVAIIPGGLTNQLQPLDVSLNKPFKEKVRSLWSNWMVGEEDHSFTRGGRLKKPSINIWCQWVLKAWEEVDPAIIVKAFKKCSISHALDGSEDDALYEDDSGDESDPDPFADVDNKVEDNPYDDIQL